MAHCENCGSYVSNDFHRVFAENTGELHECPHCTTQSERNGWLTSASR